jgi:hypothetical protein
MSVPAGDHSESGASPRPGPNQPATTEVLPQVLRVPVDTDVTVRVSDGSTASPLWGVDVMVVDMADRFMAIETAKKVGRTGPDGCLRVDSVKGRANGTTSGSGKRDHFQPRSAPRGQAPG